MTVLVSAPEIGRTSVPIQMVLELEAAQKLRSQLDPAWASLRTMTARSGSIIAEKFGKIVAICSAKWKAQDDVITSRNKPRHYRLSFNTDLLHIRREAS